ncbi:class I mannose-6-phosphate isomerase [Candidatus Sumerlaeota bacterium]|nr:class I mannose-6-phosphate isomerase [Candidatus Sumerlaeota bacterium]
MNFQTPIRLQPHLSPRPWGGTKLQTVLHKNLPPSPQPFGESWELSDHPDGPSRIISADRDLNGRTFGEVLRSHPREMIGREHAPARYPLRVKYIDAADDLSIQVHPGDDWCRAHNHEDRGKSESWYVMHADPQATIIAGYRPGTTEAAARHAIARNNLRDILQEWRLEAGDFIPLPPGTVHAMMAGTLVCEIQQSSNTTFRLYDWDRRPARALHIEESMHVTDWDRDVRASVEKFGGIGSGNSSSTFENEFFSITRHDVAASQDAHLPLAHETGAIINVVGGCGKLRGARWSEPLGLGDTFYLPASLSSPLALQANATGLRILRTISREL